ncbi:MAG: Disulfide bond formation protein DsbB [Gammaproteobacteria bacterium]|jgi:disulfide bond formation protein DsbB|nr:Disulfide bond formation protein DsbB [Gammaproteobacteria bacterium]
MFGLLRKINLAGLLICGLLLAISAYLQFYEGIAPCPLCVIQRLAILALALVFFVGTLYTHTQTLTLRIHSMVIMIFAGIGAVAAIRQIWLQHLPIDQLPASCGPDLGYILSNFPILQAVQLVFTGTGECAKVSWMFLDLTLPEWALIFFLLFIAISIFQWIRKIKG